MESLQPLRADQTCRTVRRWSISPARTYGRIDVLFNQCRHGLLQTGSKTSRTRSGTAICGKNRSGVLLTRAAWPHLKTSHGVVVNTASLNGLMSFKTLAHWRIRRPSRDYRILRPALAIGEHVASIPISLLGRRMRQ